MTLVGTFNWIIDADPAPDHAGRRTSRNSRIAACRSTSKRPWSRRRRCSTSSATTTRPDNEYADCPQDAGLRVRHTLHAGSSPARIGSHDIKIGVQYQLGEHLRDDQRYTNGSFVFPTDLDFNAADPRTYPERLTVRVPAKARLLIAHPLDRHLPPRQVAGDAEPDAEPRAALRPAHLAVQRALEPVLRRSGAYPVDKNNFQPRAGFAYNMGGTLGAARRLRAVLREAVDRPVRDLPAEPRVRRLVHRQFPGQRRRSRARATGGSRPTRSSSTGRS